jgi:hypothetical protein
MSAFSKNNMNRPRFPRLHECLILIVIFCPLIPCTGCELSSSTDILTFPLHFNTAVALSFELFPIHAMRSLCLCLIGGAAPVASAASRESGRVDVGAACLVCFLWQVHLYQTDTDLFGASVVAPTPLLIVVGLSCLCGYQEGEQSKNWRLTQKTISQSS